MFTADQYELLDFGRGRKLERFGELVIDRLSPAAENAPFAKGEAWQAADARYARSGCKQGNWTEKPDLPELWQVAHEGIQFELKRTPFGHVGLFPEQATNWSWISDQVHAAKRQVAQTSQPATEDASPPQYKVLNLFAYTGGSTLAAAAAGAEVVHVDAARNIVRWARRNAELSGLESKSIRWIAEDAQKFVQREIKRGNRYQGVILDPPAYGHGPKGEVWKIEQHLPELLDQCASLLAGRNPFLLASCHSEAVSLSQLRALMATALKGNSAGYEVDKQEIESIELQLTTSENRSLPSGMACRWPRFSRK